MSQLRYRCVCCHTVATEEYHWYHDSGQEIVWRLCGECCDFAVEMVELLANIEEEMEIWVRDTTT